ncbi:MAG: NAD(P)-dependent oxidoreductase [Clostridia bacterium]|nr:NAD(P)-dependent oxidoreductase [Clostridia bacterium]
MKITLLDAATLGEDLDISPLKRFGEVIAYPKSAPGEVAERIGDSDCVIVNKVKLNESTVGDAPNLKLVCIAATGYDNVDTEYMKSRGIGVCNAVGYSTDSVAQLTLAMALSLATNLPQFNSYVEMGEYSKSGNANCLTPVFHELSGKTWGIVGMGNIGKKVAQTAKALGCRIIVNKRTPDPQWECVDIDTLCKTADIISVHTPLNDSTRGLVSRERIASMKNDAVVINVARGAVCDEEALCEAIKEGRLGGIGVDVYSSEPFDESSPYYSVKSMPNVCLTPHMAWGSYEARVRLLNDIVKSIESYLSGGNYSRLV